MTQVDYSATRVKSSSKSEGRGFGSGRLAMSESQLNKYEEEVKRLEDELQLVQKAIPTLQAAEKCVFSDRRRSSLAAAPRRRPPPPTPTPHPPSLPEQPNSARTPPSLSTHTFLPPLYLTPNDPVPNITLPSHQTFLPFRATLARYRPSTLLPLTPFPTLPSPLIQTSSHFAQPSRAPLDWSRKSRRWMNPSPPRRRTRTCGSARRRGTRAAAS